MPVTKTEVNVAQEVINLLVGDKAEAEAYSQDPEGWLDGHGYAGVSGEAIATCGVGGGGGASAGASAGGGGAGAYAAAPPAGASAVAQLDYIVYNNYYEDNSITNNIENHGNLDFNQQIAGDNSVNVNDSTTGDVQAGEGNIQVGGDVSDSNLEAGEGDQLVDESFTQANAYGDGDAQAASATGDVTQTTGDEAPPEEADAPDPVE
ncbi:MAG TPA: hypothetical protein VF152_13805 [Acidimicrobiia bacterium]